MSADTTAQVLRELEERRCRAISEVDLVTLQGLLDDRLKHTHLNGTTENRDTYLGSVAKRPRRPPPGRCRSSRSVTPP